MSSESLTIEDYKKIVQSLLSAAGAVDKACPVSVSGSPRKVVKFQSAISQLAATAYLARKLTEGNEAP